MSAKLEELICNLNELKRDKEKKDENEVKIISECKIVKERIEKSSEKIKEYLNLMQNELELIEKNKQELKKFWENNCNPISVLPKSNIKNSYKKFAFIESPLTELMRKDNYVTIYNIFFSLFLFLIAIFILLEYIENKSFADFHIILRNYNGMGAYIVCYLIKNFICIFFVIIIQIFKDFYQKGNKHICNLVFHSMLLLLVISFNYMFEIKDTSLIFRIMHFSDNIKVVCELFSYYCEKVIKVSYILSKREENVSAQNKDEERIGHGTTLIIKDDGINTKTSFEFKKVHLFKEIKGFLYFSFAPTLIYRDKYPLCQTHNPGLIFSHFVNFVMAIGYVILTFETKINLMFNNSKLTLLENDAIIQTLIIFIIYSIIILFMLFFGIAHSYLNLLAELTKFGDRTFYGSFYATKSPIKFYKKLIKYYEDFLKAYFKPFYSKHLYEFIRILYYCIIFEYIFLNATGLSSPMLSVIIISSHLISYPFSYFKSQKMILFNWFIVSLGMGLVVFINYTEYFIVNSKEWDHNNRMIRRIIPKLWYVICHNLNIN